MNLSKQRIKNNFKKNKVYILAFLLIWVIVVSVTTYSYKDTLGKENSGNSVYDNVIAFNNNEVVQEMDVVDGSKTVSLFLSIREKNGSNIHVQVIGSNSDYKYGDVRIKDKNILNDSYNAVVLDKPLDISKDRKFKIVITSENESIDNLGIWYSDNNFSNDNVLFVNGEQVKGSLTCKILTDNSALIRFNNIIVASISICGILIILYLLLFEPKKENIYALITLILGILFIVIITPISGPDEDYHYHQTLRLSNQIMGKEDISKIEDVYLEYDGFTSQTNNCSAYKRIISSINEPLKDLSTRPITDLKESPVYSYTLCYAPAAFGVSLARICKMNFINTYYMGRLFNLLLYVFCVYFAVKKSPVIKDAFGIVATLPIFIQQAITYTQDGWICALSMLLFAFFLKWKFTDQKITKKEFIFALIVDLLLAPSKYIYSLFAIVFFFVPTERFNNKKEKILFVTLLLLPALYAVGKNIWSRIIPIIQNPEVIDSSGQTIEITDEAIAEALENKDYYNDNFSIRYILNHPMRTIEIVINTIKDRMKTWVCTAVGRSLSGGTLLIPLKIVYSFMALFVLASLQKEQFILPISNKIVIVLICLAIFGLTLATMLVGWTKYNDPIIQGVQGRYFSSFIIYLCAVLNNKKITVPQRIDKYLILVHLLLSFETIICVLSFTFAN